MKQIVILDGEGGTGKVTRGPLILSVASDMVIVKYYVGAAAFSLFSP